MLYLVTLFLFLLFSLLLCMIILAQESRSTGIGAAFGAEGVHSLLGGSSAQILKRITAWGIALFLFLCLLFSVWTSGMARNKSLAEQSPGYEQHNR